MSFTCLIIYLYLLKQETFYLPLNQGFKQAHLLLYQFKLMVICELTLLLKEQIIVNKLLNLDTIFNHYGRNKYSISRF